MKTYVVDGQLVDVEDKDVKLFVSKYSNASALYSVGGQEVEVALQDEQAFLSKYGSKIDNPMAGVDLQSRKTGNAEKAQQRIAELQATLPYSNPIARKNKNKEITHWQNVIAFNEDGMTPDERAMYEGTRQSWMGDNPTGRAAASVGMGGLDLITGISQAVAPESQFAQRMMAAKAGITADASKTEQFIDGVLMSAPMTVAAIANPLLGFAAIEGSIVNNNFQDLINTYGSIEKAGNKRVAGAIIKGTMESAIELYSDILQGKIAKSAFTRLSKEAAKTKIATLIREGLTGSGKAWLAGGFTEAGEEVVQTESNRIYDALTGEKPYGNVTDVLKEDSMAFAGGLAGGLLFGGVFGGGGKLINNQTWKQVNRMKQNDPIANDLIEIKKLILNGEVDTAKSQFDAIKSKAQDSRVWAVKNAANNIHDALLVRDAYEGTPDLQKVIDQETVDMRTDVDEAAKAALQTELPETMQEEQPDEALQPEVLPQEGSDQEAVASVPDVVPSTTPVPEAVETAEVKPVVKESLKAEPKPKKVVTVAEKKPTESAIPPKGNRGVDGIKVKKVEDILDKTVSDINGDMYDKSDIVEQDKKIVQDNIDILKEQLKEFKGRLTPEQKQKKENIVSKISGLKEDIADIETTAMEINIREYEGIKEFVSKKLKDNNIEIDGDIDEEIQSITDDIMLSLYDRPSIEANWKRKVSDVIDDVLSNLYPEIKPKKVSKPKPKAVSDSVSQPTAPVSVKGAVEPAPDIEETRKESDKRQGIVRDESGMVIDSPAHREIIAKADAVGNDKKLLEKRIREEVSTMNQSKQSDWEFDFENKRLIHKDGHILQWKNQPTSGGYVTLTKQSTPAPRTAEQATREYAVVNADMREAKAKYDDNPKDKGLRKEYETLKAQHDKLLAERDAKIETPKAENKQTFQEFRESIRKKVTANDWSFAKTRTMQEIFGNKKLTVQEAYKQGKIHSGNWTLSFVIEDRLEQWKDVDNMDKSDIEYVKKLKSFNRGLQSQSNSMENYYKKMQEDTTKHSAILSQATKTTDIYKLTQGFVSVIKGKVKSTAIDSKNDAATVTLTNGNIITINAVTGAIEEKYNGKTEFVSVGNIAALVTMSADTGETGLVGYHEGAHVAWRLYLSDNERNILLEKYGTEEQAVVAFQEHIATGKTKGLSAKIVKVFSDFWNRIRIAISRAMGAEFSKTWQDVFKSMELGQFANEQPLGTGGIEYSQMAKEAIERQVLSGQQKNVNIAQTAINNIDVGTQLTNYHKLATELDMKDKPAVKELKDKVISIAQTMYAEEQDKLDRFIEDVKSAKKTATLTKAIERLQSLMDVNNKTMHKAILDLISKWTPKQLNDAIKQANLKGRAANMLTYIQKIKDNTPEQNLEELTTLSALTENKSLPSIDTPIEEDIDLEQEVSNEDKLSLLTMYGGIAVDKDIRRNAYELAIAYGNLVRLIKDGKIVTDEFNEAQKARFNMTQAKIRVIAAIRGRIGQVEKLAKAETFKGRVADTIRGLVVPVLYLESFVEDLDRLGYKHYPEILKMLNAMPATIATYQEAVDQAQREYDTATAEWETAKAGDAKNAAFATRKLKEKALKFQARKLNYAQFDLQVLQEITPYFESYKGNFKGWAQENLYKPIRDAYTQQFAGDVKYQNILGRQRAILAKKYGRQELLFIHMTKYSIDMLENNKRIAKKFTIESLATVYAHSKNPKEANTLINTGFDEKALAQVMDIMDTTTAGQFMKEWVDYVVDEFYPMYYHGINKVFRQRYGFDMPYEPIYTPIVRKVEVDDKFVEVGKGRYNAQESFAIFMAALIERTGSQKALNLQQMDFDLLLINHVKNMEHFKAFAMPMHLLRNTLLTRKTLSILEDAFGTPWRRQLVAYFNDIAANGFTKRTNNRLERSLFKMQRLFTFGALNMNIGLLPKQLTSMIAFFNDDSIHNNPVAFVNGINWVINNKSEYMRAIKDSPDLSMRWKEAINADMLNALPETHEVNFTTTIQRFMNTYTNFAKFGDIGAVVFGGAAVFGNTYMEAISKGKTKEQARKQATDALVAATNRTQQSASIPYIPGIRRDGFIGNLLTLFQSQSFAYFNQLYNAIQNGKYTPERKARITAQLINTVVMQQIIYGAIATGLVLPDDQEDAFWMWLAYTLQIFPLIGNWLGEGIMKVRGKEWHSTTMFAMQSSFDNAMNLPGSISRILEKGKDEDYQAGQDLYKLAKATAPSFGVPLGNADRLGQLIGTISTGITPDVFNRDPRVGRYLGFSTAAMDAVEKFYQYNDNDMREYPVTEVEDE